MSTSCLVRAESPRALLGTFAFGACLIPIWMLFHPYVGIVHDATLYALCALARIHPVLADDLFLRFGSQDHFTLFSPLFAIAIQHLGLETAAAVLTFLSQTAFFACAYCFARRLMPAKMALLSVGLLIVLPADYGAFRTFKFSEGFITPRLLAEALTLAALAYWQSERKRWGFLLLAVAFAIHPIMATAGVALILMLDVALPRPKLSIILALGGFALLAAVAYAMPIGPITIFDDEWLRLVQDRSPYSFMHLWTFDDGMRAALPLGTLLVLCMITASKMVRKISATALLVGAAGIVLTFIGSDTLRIVLITQLQPWRWLWLANVCTVLLLPVLVAEGWKSAPIARASLALLASAWILQDQDPLLCLIALTAALAVFLLRQHVSDSRPQRWILLGAGTMLVAVVCADLIELSAFILDPDPYNPTFPLRPTWSKDLFWPVALLGGLWAASKTTTRFLVGPATVASAAVIGAIAIFPLAWDSWTRSTFSPSARDVYARFRAQIPESSEVLWPEAPLEVWYLLERRSYLSLNQTAGVVFSRASAVELKRRSAATAPLLPEFAFAVWGKASDFQIPAEKKLAEACKDGDLTYVVSANDLGVPPLAEVTPNPLLSKVKTRLYSCSSLRR